MENKTLASVVKSAREKLGISQRELSRRTGIDNNTVAKIEKGERKKPNVLSLTKIAFVLELNSKELLELAGYSEEEYIMMSNKIPSNLDSNTTMMLADVIGDGLKYDLFARKTVMEYIKNKEYMNLEKYKALEQAEKNKIDRVFKGYLEDYRESVKEIEGILKNIELAKKKK